MKIMSCYLVSYLVLSFFYSSLSHPLFDLTNVDDLVEKLRSDIEKRIDLFERPDDGGDDLPLLATLVRLVFHDCGGRDYGRNDVNGICNGCIDPLNHDHDGLEYGVIYPLEQVYQNQDIIVMNKNGISVTYDVQDASYTWRNPSGIKWSDYLNRADFWAISGTMAVEYGVELAYDHSKVDRTGVRRPQTWNEALGANKNIRYYFGRETTECVSDTAWNNDPGVDRFFTNPLWGHRELFAFFKQKFDFTPIQSVAIMGAHTLGRGHAMIEQVEGSQEDDTKCCSGSGFRGGWIRRNKFMVDNGYYGQMMNFHDFAAVWEQIAPCDSGDGICDPGFLSESEALQWKVQRCAPEPDSCLTDLRQMMFNADLAIAFDIQDLIDQQAGNGKVNCNHPLFNANEQDYTVPSCERLYGFNGEIKNEFDRYATDNIHWLQNFWDAWEQMITSGYRNLRYTESNA